jgi:hypothetical protein
VDHADVLGSCFSCHNGTTAPGKSQNHIASDNNCDDCHNTNGWTPAVFDHSNVAPGSCNTCHNGATVTGKPSNHILTSAQCDACHNTIAWTPANFDHDSVNGSCSSCHNGTQATGKPGNHFTTNLQCDTCHTTNNWSTLIFSHSSGNYPGDHRGNLGCNKCHTSNSQVISWPAPGYKPDCAGCHAADYKSGPHKKSESPKTFYTVGELRDCSGACHVYTDNSHTTIEKNRSGPKHTVTQGDF